MQIDVCALDNMAATPVPEPSDTSAEGGVAVDIDHAGAMREIAAPRTVH